MNPLSSPVKVLYGPDGYTRERILGEARKRFSGCETVILYGAETSPREVISEIQSGSLFSSSRLIIIKDPGASLLKEISGFLKDYSRRKEAPSEVILELESGTLPASLKGLQTKKTALPYENKLPVWAVKEAAARGKRLDPEAAELIAFYCGRNLYAISGEIDKLITAFPDKRSYSADDLRKTAGTHKKDDIFGFIDALIDGREKKALLLLENLLEYNEKPLRITGVIKWKLQQMISARILMEKGFSEKEIIEKIKLKPAFFYRGFCRRIKRFTPESLMKAYSRLRKTDLGIKSLPVDGGFQLENFLFSFFSGN